MRMTSLYAWQVAAFYRFWTGLKSWRDFSLLAEHDYKEVWNRAVEHPAHLPPLPLQKV